MRIATLLACCLVTALIASALSGPHARAQRQGGGEAQVTEVAVRTLGPRTFLYAETETTLGEMGGVARAVLERLEKLEAAKKAEYPGAVIFVYRGATMDPNRKFKLQIGYAVAEGTEAPAGGEFKVRRLEPFKCATVLYGGPLSSVGSAYEKLMGTVGRQRRKTTDETREYYLHWEGEESPNNVEMIAVGLEG